MKKIIHIIDVQPFDVVCEFNNGEVRKINFNEWVKEFENSKNGWTSKLAQPAFFNSVKLASYGTLLWENDIDFDPEVLYEMSVPA